MGAGVHDDVEVGIGGCQMLAEPLDRGQVAHVQTVDVQPVLPLGKVLFLYQEMNKEKEKKRKYMKRKGKPAQSVARRPWGSAW
jgi:hypothetical protein